MPRNHKHRGVGGWLFLIIVLGGYGLSFLLSPESTMAALALFHRALQQVLPTLGLVFLLLFLANWLLTPARVRQYLGKPAGLKGWLAAIIAGILSMGPVYAWYVAVGELQKKGMSTALAATFLYSRAIKLPLLPLMIYYFGASYTVVLSLYLIAFAVINGIVVDRLLAQRT
jgi:uncharacterized membrane protein YraQ (UPF0718 family)